MNQQHLINLVTKHGLIFLTDEHPKTLPAHQRLLSKLEKFYEEAFNAGYNEGIGMTINERNKCKYLNHAQPANIGLVVVNSLNAPLQDITRV